MSTRKALRAEGDYLKKYFNKDPRFEFVGIIGAGATGVASRVRYNNPDNGAYKNFVIKRSINKLAEQRALRNEEAHIRVRTKFQESYRVRTQSNWILTDLVSYSL